MGVDPLVGGTWTAEYEGPDGQRSRFPRMGAGFAGRVAGIDALVEPRRGRTGSTLAWFDGRRWDFDAAGRLRRAWAGPGTGVAFRHDEDGRLRGAGARARPPGA